MNELLLKNNILNTDLKPKNILYDPDSEEIIIIDLGKSICVEENNGLENFDLTRLEFACTKLYCPPELQKGQKGINLKKCMSFLCGATVAKLTGVFKKESRIIGEKTDLSGNLMTDFKNFLNGLLHEDPQERLSIEDAITQIESIHTDDDEIEKAIF